MEEEKQDNKIVEGTMRILNWLTDHLQVKVLLAMSVLALISWVSITQAVSLFTTHGVNTADGVQSPEVVIASLFSVAMFSIGALAGIAKDLITPAPGKSEGYDLFMRHMELEHSDKE